MLSENPISIPRGGKLSKSELSQAIRYAIIAELDAINLYIQFANATDDEKAKSVFLDIAREEKTHVGEFLELLLSLDPEQVKELEEGREEVRELIGKSH